MGRALINSMILRQLQGLLTRLYDVPNRYAVDDFLITDRQDMTHDATHATDEQVLVERTGDSLHVGVYIAAEVLKRLGRNNPLDALDEENLGDFCTALEGVSHFHYLTWQASRDRPVSLLELELQAEVDKYVAAIYLLTLQRAGKFPATLHERLFHRVHYLEGLDAESLTRYQAANRYAARFCRRLDERFLRSRRVRAEAWLAELRLFYRLSHAQKLYCVTV